MAVIQISKIQVRRGYNEQLPQLDSGELGWSIDTRQLYIGNGTSAEGSPNPGGVTELLTEFSAGQTEMAIAIIEGNIANIQANIATIQSTIASITPATVVLADNSSGNTGIITQSMIPARINYNIVRNTTARVGTLKITNYNGTATYDDEYDETANTGVTFGFTTYGTNVAVTYTTTSTGFSANLTYTIATA